MKKFNFRIVNYCLILFFLVVTVFWKNSNPEVLSQPSFALDTAPAVVVFKDETLNDLARLLRPLALSTPSAPDGITAINLRDAIYVGAKDGKAQILTLWLTETNNENSALFIPSDSTLQHQNVANRLVTESLPNVTFVVIPVEISWKDWTLTVSRQSDFTVKGIPAIATKLRTAILNTPATLTEVNTRSVRIPISYGETKLTTWQPWFFNDQIIIKMLPMPAAVPSDSPPDIIALEGKSGILIGQEFLNNVFSNELKNKFFGREMEGKSYHVNDLKFVSDGSKVSITSNYVGVPPGATAQVQVDFTGPDMSPINFSVPANGINCKSPVSALKCAQLRAELIAAGIFINDEIKPCDPQKPNCNPNKPLPKVRRDGPMALGDFFISTKLLNGIAQIDQIEPKNGAIAVIGKFRFRGGQFL